MNATTLKEVVRKNSKAGRTNANKSSQYQADLRHFVQTISQAEDATVRLYIAQMSETPRSVLKNMLARETEVEILQALTLHPQLPDGSVALFIATQSEELLEKMLEDPRVAARFDAAARKAGSEA